MTDFLIEKNFLTKQQQAERREDIKFYLHWKKINPDTSYQVAKILIK